MNCMSDVNTYDLRYFRLAKNASENSDFRQHHIGCIAVLNHHILDTSWNTNRTSPLQAYYNQYRGLYGNGIIHKCHAEIQLINKLKKLHGIDFSKVDIYIYREWKDHKVALARPCNSCYHALYDIGIKNLYYTTYGGYKYEEVY